jgi:heterodisulfide reductase subunit D
MNDIRNDINIILFLCTWEPHAAFQTLQDSSRLIPAQVKMVRIPCSGRISKALLFKAFEMGADGVALVGCGAGACRYGAGPELAEDNIESLREILDLLGLKKERLRLGHFKGHDDAGLYQFIENFCKEIDALGKSPVASQQKPVVTEDLMARSREIVQRYDVYACQDCGKCTSACSLTLSGKPFSPRAIAQAVISGNLEDESIQNGIWSCLTCGLCYDRCPSAVNFPEFIRDIRHVLRLGDSTGSQAHGGFFHSLYRTMTSPKLPVKPWKWLPDDLKIDPAGKIAFFGGCAPYFDVFFKNHLKIDTRRILSDSIRLLNFFDIQPALLDSERCCGHDLLWSGDRENFLNLARLNVEAISQHNVEEVIFACPECYRTFLREYPDAGVPVNFKVTHIYDFLEQEIAKGSVGFKEFGHHLTFQDPCRLSRFENRPELPRKLIGRLRPQSFTEMADRGAGSLCCGNTAWTGCDSHSKALQVQRIRQAKSTGSDMMITACPKCQIHLQCAMEDPFLGDELKIKTLDLASVLARTIMWE